MPTNYLLVILYGSPGSGKTTLSNELVRSGFACVPEAAREIIRKQMAIQGDALPWKNRRRYTERMLERSVADFDRCREQGGLFFRPGHSRHTGLYPPDTAVSGKMLPYEAAARRYVPDVFLLPPWKSIYSKDSEQRQNFTTAVRTFSIIAETYRNLGYRIIVLPKEDPSRRADRLLQWLENHTGIRTVGY